MKARQFYYDDYSGGLNDTANQRRIKGNEASVLRNWDITYKGSLRRRDGLTAIGKYMPIDIIRISENIVITKT